jgi:hypothetical protein
MQTRGLGTICLGGGRMAERRRALAELRLTHKVPCSPWATPGSCCYSTWTLLPCLASPDPQNRLNLATHGVWLTPSQLLLGPLSIALGLSHAPGIHYVISLTALLQQLRTGVTANGVRLPLSCEVLGKGPGNQEEATVQDQ